MTRTLSPWRSPTRSAKRPVPSLARFESEDQFWLAVRDLSDLSQRYCDASRLLWYDPTRGRRLTPSAKQRKLEAGLLAAQRRLLAARATLWRRVQASGTTLPAPRLVRLANRLEIDATEFELATILVLTSSDPGALPHGFGRRAHVDIDRDLLDRVEMGPEFLDRLLRGRTPLTRHGIVQLEENSISGARAWIDRASAAALRGLPRQADDLHAVPDGPLRWVLREEPAIAALLEAADPTPEPTASELDPLPPDQTDAPGWSQPSEDGVGPFRTDLEYVATHLELFQERLAVRERQRKGNRIGLAEVGSAAGQLQEARARVAVLEGRLAARLRATRESGTFDPAGEQFAGRFGLNQIEKHTLICCAAASRISQFQEALNGGGMMFRGPTIGLMLTIFTDTLEEEVAAQRFFEQGSALLRSGLMTVDSTFGDILTGSLKITPRAAAQVVGVDDDTQLAPDGAYLFRSDVSLDTAQLSDKNRAHVERLVAWLETRRKIDEAKPLTLVPGRRGKVVLLHGPPGVGKTMVAKGIAHRLGRRILLANWPGIDGQILRLLFREAQSQDAILFIDECDTILASRSLSHLTGTLLTELDRFDGFCILATNRPEQLDFALHRRISDVIAIDLPDEPLREAIFKVHLRDVPAGGEMDLAELASQTEGMSGGNIANIVADACTAAELRCPLEPVVQLADLDTACREQRRRRFQSSEFHDTVEARGGFETLVVSAGVMAELEDLVAREKVRPLLERSWGLARFGGQLGSKGLFWGPPGTGKTLAAESVGYETGRPVKRLNAAGLISKWVGDSGKNIVELFREAAASDMVLIIDEGDALFAARTDVATATDRYANHDTAILLQQMERYRGLLIVTTNHKELIDPAFARRFDVAVEFAMPDRAQRAALWKHHLPAELPVADGLDLNELAEWSEGLTGGDIRVAVQRAAVRAARRGRPYQVTQTDLIAGLEGGNRRPARTVGFRAAGQSG